MMQNPLVQKNIHINIDDVMVEMTHQTIPKYFKYLYVIVKLNDINLPQEIYQAIIEKDSYQLICDNLIIRKASIKILKSKEHYKSINIISRDILQPFNKFGYQLDEYNMVITILNTSLLKIENYLSQYEVENSLEKIYNMLLYKQYFNTLGNIKYIQQMPESLFWSIENNCNLTISNLFFSKRHFQYTKCLDANPEVQKALEKMEDYLNSSGYSYLSITQTIKNKQRILTNYKIFL